MMVKKQSLAEDRQGQQEHQSGEEQASQQDKESLEDDQHHHPDDGSNEGVDQELVRTEIAKNDQDPH